MVPNKHSSPTPEFPRNPNKNYIPFENPKPPCSVPHCPNFATAECGFCEFHCKKIHKGDHSKAKDVLKELLDKYLEDYKKKVGDYP